jgi:hypothetical protein
MWTSTITRRMRKLLPAIKQPFKPRAQFYQTLNIVLLAVPGQASLRLSVAEFEMKGKRKHTFMMCLMLQCLLVYNIFCCTIVCEYLQVVRFTDSRTRNI